jgi:hypothetical protein
MRFVRTAAVTIYVLAAAWITLEYLNAYPVLEFFPKLREILFFALFVLVCIACGLPFAAKSSSIFNGEGEKYLFSFVLGAGALSLLMFFLGIAGLMRPAVIWIFTAAILLVQRRPLISLLSKIPGSAQKILKTCSSYPALYIPAGIALGLVFLASLAPPTYYDSLSYHYALPGLYVTSGKISELPFNFYSHFPQNFEMLYAYAMLIAGEVAPNFITFSAGAFTLAAIFLFARRFADAAVGGVAVLFLSTAAAFMLLSTGGYVEAGLALYVFMAIYSLAIFLEKQERPALIFSGVFCGFALGTKYTGGIAFAVLFFLLLIAGAAGRVKKPAMSVLIFAFSALLLFLPWLAKNYVSTGNPVFPFLYEHLGFRNVPLNSDLARNYFGMLKEYNAAGLLNLFRDIFLFPYYAINSPQKYGGGFDMLGDFGWIFFITACPAVVLLPGRKNGAVKLLSLFGAAFFVVWLMTKPILRFLYPVLPAAAFIAAYGAVNFWRRGGVMKYLLTALASIFVVSNFYMYFAVERFIEPFGAAIGTETRAAYLSRKLLSSPYPAFSFINEELPADSLILFVGERRGYYCRRKYVTIEVFSAGQNPIVEWANSSPDAAGFRSRLKENGFTHVLYNVNEGERLRGYGLFNFSRNGSAVWDSFVSGTPRIFDAGGVIVFQLR